MRRVLLIVAIAASFLAFLATAGTGLFLAGVQQSGERGAGFLLATTGACAFAAMLFVATVPPARLRDRRWKTAAAFAAVLAAVPPAALAVMALFFVGLPVGSAVPSLDWSLFATGLAFAAGALSILTLGYLKTATGAGPPARRPEAHQVRPDGPQTGPEAHHEGSLYAPLRGAGASSPEPDSLDEVRVTRAL